MKRIWVSLLIIVLICIVAIISVLFLKSRSEEVKVESFSMTNYQWEIQTFSTDQNVGEVNDKNTAIEKSKSLWIEKYSADIPNRKIKVAYDEKEESWHVYSVSPPNTLGGVLHTIIQKNGDVLAVWSED